MKFGKRLVSEVNTEWGNDPYIAYKKLKQRIKGLAESRKGVAAPDDAQEGFAFVANVADELRRVMAFYEKHEKTLAEKIESLKKGEKVDASAVSDAYTQARLLSNYAHLNIEGFDNIIKKFRKNSLDRANSLQKASEIQAEVHSSTLAGGLLNADISNLVQLYANASGRTGESEAVLKEELEKNFQLDARSKPRCVSLEASAYFTKKERMSENTYACKLITGTPNRLLAEDVAECLGLSLQDARVSSFANGEIDIKVMNNVRGDDLFIVHSTTGTNENPKDINSAVMELLLLIHTLRLASAKRITAVVPYLAYSRQDRKTQPRVPISASALATMIKSMGVDRLVTVDLHCSQIQGFYGNTPVDNLFAVKEFVKYLGEKKLPDNFCVVSPDAGGVERARTLADALGAQQVVTILKRRVEKNKVDSMQLVGDVSGRVCVIIDDMIDTAGTLVKAVQLLADCGATKVIACATHGVLTDPAVERINSCGPLEEVVVTDSIPQLQSLSKCPKLRVLTVAPLLAEAILRIHKETSLSELFK